MVLGGADGPGTEEGCGGNEEEKELRHLKLTCAVGGNVTWCSHCGKQYGASSEKTKNRITI